MPARGLGATAGSYKGGLGSASAVTDDGFTVGALVAVNGLGSPLIPGTDVFWAFPFEQNGEFGGRRVHKPLPQLDLDLPSDMKGAPRAGENTTIAIVATDASLTRVELKRIAIMASDGFARALRPVHTPFDGDIVFAVSTAQRPIEEPRHAMVMRLGIHRRRLPCPRHCARRLRSGDVGSRRKATATFFRREAWTETNRAGRARSRAARNSRGADLRRPLSWPGFTLCTGPLNAATIVTDADGLDAGEVKVPVVRRQHSGLSRETEGKGAPAAGARGAGDLRHPRTHPRHLPPLREARLLCDRAFALCALRRSRQIRHEHGAAIGDGHRVEGAGCRRDVRSGCEREHSRVGDGADAKRLGITGFCWGGRIVWMYAAHNPNLKAGVAWYGQLRGPVPPNPLRPKYPLELVDEINAPVLGFYGGQDKGIPVSDVEDMKAALAKAGKLHSKLEVFMDTGHGFFADYRPSYNEKDAQTGWRELQAWFRAHGVS